MATGLSRWFKRLTSDDDELDADALSEQSAVAGCQQADGCVRGARVVLLGRLRFVDLRPTDALASLVAELFDGTEPVLLIWLGRRSIRGIEPGRVIRARGRLAIQDGRKVIYNPDYELFPAAA